MDLQLVWKQIELEFTNREGRLNHHPKHCLVGNPRDQRNLLPVGVSKKPQHSNFQDAPKNCGFNTFEKPKNIWAESLALKLTPSIAFQFFPFLNCKNRHKQP